MQCHTRIISLLFILCYLFYASILAIKCKQIIQANDRSHKLDHGLLKVVVVPLAKPFTVYVTQSHAQTHARDTIKVAPYSGDNPAQTSGQRENSNRYSVHTG